MSPGAYRDPVAFSDAGLWALQFAALPDDIAELPKVLHGLLIHEHLAEAYGVTLSERQRREPHVRGAAELLERVAVHDPRPLRHARAPGERFAGCCRHFTLLHVAMLRNKGIAARARCGFGAYFTKGKFVDHWVTEYFDEERLRWVLVDAQIDERQRTLFGIDFDTQDVPRDRFLVAGDAWRLCRDGKADPLAFGVLDMAGLWFIAGNVVRDVAALNNREMLPWDVWGAMVQADREIDLAFIDRLAALTHQPDRHFDELRAVYADPRIAVPPTVFNAVLGRPEAVSPLVHSA